MSGRATGTVLEGGGWPGHLCWVTRLGRREPPTASSGGVGINTPSSSSLGLCLPHHWHTYKSLIPLSQLLPKHSNQGFLLGFGCESIWGVGFIPFVRALHSLLSRSTCGGFGWSIRVCYSWSLLLNGYASPVECPLRVEHSRTFVSPLLCGVFLVSTNLPLWWIGWGKLLFVIALPLWEPQRRHGLLSGGELR
jgi:hypothetical protein